MAFLSSATNSDIMPIDAPVDHVNPIPTKATLSHMIWSNMEQNIANTKNLVFLCLEDIEENCPCQRSALNNGDNITFPDFERGRSER